MWSWLDVSRAVPTMEQVHSFGEDLTSPDSRSTGWTLASLHSRFHRWFISESRLGYPNACFALHSGHRRRRSDRWADDGFVSRAFNPTQRSERPRPQTAAVLVLKATDGRGSKRDITAAVKR